MADVHILYPSLYREPISGFRKRFPAPWSIEAFAGGYRVLDAVCTRLITIEVFAVQRPGRLARPQALMLAQAIARMGNSRG